MKYDAKELQAYGLDSEKIELVQKSLGFMDNDVFGYVLGSEDEMSNCILKNLISMIIKKMYLM